MDKPTIELVFDWRAGVLTQANIIIDDHPPLTTVRSDTETEAAFSRRIQFYVAALGNALAEMPAPTATRTAR